MTDRELMQQALEALEQYTDVVASGNEPDTWITVVDAGKPARDAITALRERLAEQDINQMEAEFKHNIRKTQDRIRDKVRPGVYEVTGPLHVVCQCDKCKAQPEPGCAECGKSGGWALYCVACMEKLAQPEQEPVAHTTGHCENHKQKGGCQLHNLQCGWPDCDRKPITSPPQRKPEQKPVAWMDEFGNVFPLGAQRGPKHLNEPMKPLYTTPPRREWVGLTDEDCVEAIDENFDFALDHGNVSNASVIRYARAIEAKLKEKNA